MMCVDHTSCSEKKEIFLCLYAVMCYDKHFKFVIKNIMNIMNNKKKNNNNNNNLIYDNNNICDDSVNGLRLGFSDFLHDPSIINTVYNPNLIDEILRMEYQNYLGGGI
ncbi:hypothetical protein Glove_522g89 [Diversispora epigaea]|uniref:Uncharacterized protein n=1 Tax=Diversispora epigaea TaxID=1348612 RepID=A0A397GMZ5_9GLOM|nr:hypothetical protein Glove_522g89 [Diversispora epigaea]